MKLSTKIIGNFDGHYSRAISANAEALILTIFLHKHEKINRDKMMAMFTAIRSDKFCRQVNTYHCRINDKWYNGENMLTILKDAFSCVMFPMKTRVDFEMELAEFLKYLNLYLNKNRNYCIDFLQSEIVEPIIDNFKTI